MTLSDDLEVREYLHVLRRRWRLMGGLGVLMAVVAMAVPVFRGTLYEVSTTIKVEVRGRIEDGDVNTVAERWRSEWVLGEVLSRLGLRPSYAYAAAHMELETGENGLRLIIRSRNPQEGRAIAQMLAAKLITDLQRRRTVLLRTIEELRPLTRELWWQMRVLKRARVRPSSVKRFFRRCKAPRRGTQEKLRAAIEELRWQTPVLKRAIAGPPPMTWTVRGRTKSGRIDLERARRYPTLTSTRQSAFTAYSGLLTGIETQLSELMATQISVEPHRVTPLSPLPPTLQRFLAAAALGVAVVVAVVGLVAGRPRRLLTRDASDTIQPFFA